MNYAFHTALLSVGMFLGIVLMLEIGRRMGEAQRARKPGVEIKGSSAAEGAVFGLLGLLIAFTFSGAATRFEDRRHLITEEANDIGTAWLRVDLLPSGAQPGMRDLFRRYLDARLEAYSHASEPERATAEFSNAAKLQQEIWSAAIAAAREPGASPDAAKLLLPALNEMIDITTTRLVATQNHPPVAIFAMLGVLSMLGGLLIGYDQSGKTHRETVHMLVYALIMSGAVFVILDLEYPRMGLIRIDSADQILLDLRSDMG